jgi:TP53 regulating kinase and related kinases
MSTVELGAEAKVTFKDETVIKERIRKSYRHETIDNSIRKKNTRKEAKLLQKANELVPTPKVFDFCDKEMKIRMEKIEGDKLRDVLHKVDRKEIFARIGKKLAKLHNNNIIHGDLTTSNLIVNEKIYFIDFGLGFVSTKVEDKAVDIHLIRKALESKHNQYLEECFNSLMKSYLTESNFPDDIIKRLEKVEKRGRYKQK